MDDKFIVHFYEIAMNKLKQRPLPPHLREYQDGALNEFFVNLIENCEDQKTQKLIKKLQKMPHEDQGKYVYTCISHLALKLQSRRDKIQPRPFTLPPTYAADPDGQSITDLIYPSLNHEERLLFVLLSWEYMQIQIAEILDINIVKVHRKVKSLREKIKRILKGEFQMSGKEYTDKEIYDFIYRKSGAKEIGNENLRRDIKRTLKPILEGIPPLIGAAGGDQPIPPGMSRQINETINNHAEPPMITDVLEMLPQAEPLELCLDLLEAARQLNKPHRWITPEESLNAIENPINAKAQIGCLCRLLEKIFHIFKEQCKRLERNDEQLTKILCGELVSLANRFKSQRGTGDNPFIILSDTKKEPLHKDAIKMKMETESAFKTSLENFNDVCGKMIKNSSDANTTIQNLQLLVDWHIRLLEWEIFDSPRYLAPAIMEEAIEVVRACYNLDGEKNLFQEIGQLVYMTLWLSNVLAIPNLGYQLMKP